MITLAQAGALLTLTESLEECATLNLELCPSRDGGQNLQFRDSSEPVAYMSALTGAKIRFAAGALLANQEESK